jgi:putative phosphoesterase
MKVLVIGDTHIPSRAEWLPKAIDDFVTSQRFDIVICTGDLTDRKVLEYLRRLGDELIVVGGNMDHLPLPESQTLKIEDIKVGVIHGHQVYPRGDRRLLTEIADRLGVDLLLHGHTHTPDVYFKDVLLLNPGSATGVWSGGGGSLIPSFMVLEFEGSTVNVKLYELKKKLDCTISESFEL